MYNYYNTVCTQQKGTLPPCALIAGAKRKSGARKSVVGGLPRGQVLLGQASVSHDEDSRPTRWDYMTSARDSDDGLMQRGARLRQQKDVLSLNTCKSDGGARAIEHWRAQAHIGLAARYIARPGRRKWPSCGQSHHTRRDGRCVWTIDKCPRHRRCSCSACMTDKAQRARARHAMHCNRRGHAGRENVVVAVVCGWAA